uniref:Uncharacterized protein n=1 Tax=Phaeodactylum tricornutum TaxID=2850 RepID=A0A8J9TFV4_PHATR
MTNVRETCVEEPDSLGSRNIPNLPNHPTQPYQYLCCDHVEKMLRDDYGQTVTTPSQLVWVCKSKGRSRRRQRQRPTSREGTKANEDNLRQASLEHSDEKLAISNLSTTTFPLNQRLELFSRAKVVKLVSDDTVKDVDDNNNNNNNRTKESGEASSLPHSRSSLNHPQSQRTYVPRVLVQYPRGSTYHVALHHLVPILDETVTHKIVVCGETATYRRACLVHVLPHEHFVEIGCDVGVTVQRVHRATASPTTTQTTVAVLAGNHDGRRMVGIDKSIQSIQTARQLYPHLSFYHWDILASGSLHQKNHDDDNNDENNNSASEPQKEDSVHGTMYDGMPHALQSAWKAATCSDQSLVVAIDINGNREVPAVLACITRVWALGNECSNEHADQPCITPIVNTKASGATSHDTVPRLIIVKSRALYNVLRSQPERALSIKQDEKP